MKRLIAKSGIKLGGFAVVTAILAVAAQNLTNNGGCVIWFYCPRMPKHMRKA
jgi:hypothetical protein